MIKIFTLKNGRLVGIEPSEIATHIPIWVDIIAPSEEERDWINRDFPLGRNQGE